MRDAALSVVMSSYNYGSYIGDALDAILSQSFRPYEVIIVDDASTDNSAEVINEFVRRDPIVKLVRNERNMGVHFVTERGISLATGDYIYGAAADDRILPTFFEKSIDLLEQYPQAGLCSSDMAYIDVQGNRTGEYRAADIAQASFLSPSEVLAELYKNPNYIIGGTTIFRRSALDEAGGFPPQLLSLCDWFTERAIALKHGACYIPEALFLWRRTNENYSDACFRDTERMFEVIGHTVELMRSPRYRENFPPEFVQFWSEWFGEQVIDAKWVRLVQHRNAFLEELGRCANSSSWGERLFRRALRFTGHAELLFCRLYLKRLRLRSILREIERTN